MNKKKDHRSGILRVVRKTALAMHRDGRCIRSARDCTGAQGVIPQIFRRFLGLRGDVHAEEKRGGLLLPLRWPTHR